MDQCPNQDDHGQLNDLETNLKISQDAYDTPQYDYIKNVSSSSDQSQD